MYRLATVQVVIDRQTDRQSDDSIMPVANHTAWDYDRLKIPQKIVFKKLTSDLLQNVLWVYLTTDIVLLLNSFTSGCYAESAVMPQYVLCLSVCL